VVFKEGDFISSDRLNEKFELTRSNIINTNLFLEVAIGHTVDSLQMLDVTVYVKERWYWSVLPYLVLSDRSFNEWWYERGRDLRRLTYGVNLTQYNFTGNADIFSAGAYMGFAPHYTLGYSRPYIDKRKRFGVSGRVFYTSRRNLAYRTWNDKLAFISSDSLSFSRYGASGEFRYRRDYNYFHTAFLGFSESRISDTVVRAARAAGGAQLTVSIAQRLPDSDQGDIQEILTLRGGNGLVVEAAITGAISPATQVQGQTLRALLNIPVEEPQVLVYRVSNETRPDGGGGVCGASAPDYVVYWEPSAPGEAGLKVLGVQGGAPGAAAARACTLLDYRRQ